MESDTGVVARGPGAGPTFQMGKREVVVKANYQDPNFSMGAFESSPEPGFSTAPHVHHEYEEAFYVAEGVMDFHIGGQTTRLAAGSFALVPRGTVHSFVNPGPGSAKMLVLVWPAEALQLIVEQGRLVAGAVPNPPDPTALVELYKRHNSELILPHRPNTP